METWLKYIIAVSLGLSSAAAFAGDININADAKGNIENKLSFSVYENRNDHAHAVLQSLGSLSVHDGGFNKDIPNDGPHINNAINGDYHVQVTITAPGVLAATTYCSVQQYRFSSASDAKPTIVSFDPNTPGVFNPWPCS